MCTRNSYSTPIAPISRQHHNKRRCPQAAARRRQAAARLPAGANPQPQPAGSQDNGNVKLVLPQLTRLHEAFKGSQVSPPASSSSQD